MIPFEEHRKRAIEDTVLEIGDCEEPVTILRIFHKNFMRGRPLDPVDESTYIAGQTTEIFVSRMNLYYDAMEEILFEGSAPVDRSLPLEVIFTGEHGRDFGGPRKEFFSNMLRLIKEKLCVENKEEGGFVLVDNVTARTNRFYYGAGIIFGYSLLQGGPLPCFFSERQLQTFFTEDQEKTEMEEQFVQGIASFGLPLLVKWRRCLLFLFRQSAVSPLTYPRLVRLLNPNFSEVGSNRRMLEEKAYRYLLKYMKEVAAGRRGSIKLEHILMFATCCENEPVLGYGLSPRIEFVYAKSPLPTANTCINKMSLVIGGELPNDEERMFEFFDIAFVNTHFGLV
ncbi:G2 M phase-specific E3 ubiquitin- ligase [Paramuricea clavata]|uniref:G2 M phase-specific E3 ubiquitin- ligase n=1 Tax=Paramuricea clavata TaxID=317549 RepID=A0A6S7KBN2_PARCT|nr:G2 M phase-specific E3 ubiquitin- ligase [Paramuricea clavata]